MENMMVKKIVFQDYLKSKGINWNASTIWRKEKEGKFPKHFMFGNRRAWHDHVIDDFVESLGATEEVA
jgi:predicted DNA-binding transcriptional regulator AlpA